MSADKERFFEVTVTISKEFTVYDDTPIKDVKWSVKDELRREHNIDCDNPDVEPEISEGVYPTNDEYDRWLDMDNKGIVEDHKGEE